MLSLQDNLEGLKSNAETSSRVKNSLCLSSFLNSPYFVDDKGGTPPPNADVKMNLRSDPFLTYNKLKNYRLFSDKDKRRSPDTLHRHHAGRCSVRPCPSNHQLVDFSASSPTCNRGHGSISLCVSQPLYLDLSCSPQDKQGQRTAPTHCGADVSGAADGATLSTVGWKGE